MPPCQWSANWGEKKGWQSPVSSMHVLINPLFSFAFNQFLVPPASNPYPSLLQKWSLLWECGSRLSVAGKGNEDCFSNRLPLVSLLYSPCLPYPGPYFSSTSGGISCHQFLRLLCFRHSSSWLVFTVSLEFSFFKVLNHLSLNYLSIYNFAVLFTLLFSLIFYRFIYLFCGQKWPRDKDDSEEARVVTSQTQRLKVTTQNGVKLKLFN